MSYTTQDFTESLVRVALDRENVERVVAAWGSGDGQGDDAGHMHWAEDGVTDWGGGFLMLLKDGRYAYLTGWCDYTGWGCQDGARLDYFDAEPALSSLTRYLDPEYVDVAADPAPPPELWDIEPADLNRWLTSGEPAP